MIRPLILGGTTEAGRLAQAVADAGIAGIYSYAGRTAAPKAQPLPMRVGGFGGIDGLVDYLGAEGITHLIDATHPFAASMSAHAVEAARRAGVPLIAFERAPWTPGPGDDWRSVPDMAGAVAALDGPRRRVFLAIGRQHLDAFAGLSQHRYLLRLVDAPDGPLPLADAVAVVDRGPFTLAGDRTLMEAQDIEVVVAKNAGGDGARAKLDAARTLRLPVIMIERPAVAPRPTAGTIEAILDWLHHPADLGV
ncbi:cobalt-precorrin-6A reductase [Zavarzinia compransoris]|uniref:cobalt-precorrin-6A reductase n=1 Tax=Zavarzinia marina TaxID=2911065 RepID=UPI001F31EB4E|nr:cobalt-precorrin-6A reductase [Zavarzinia marina]MCF4167388.1 cobalt-precorrin-6A reductase [Zavarzinia marina]